MTFRPKFMRRSCRQVTAMLLESQDRSLGWFERATLRMHLSVCDACTRFKGQVALMREALPRWRKYRDGGE